MSYLVDTNVVSEIVKKSPEKKVLEWVSAIPTPALYISVLTLGEIRKGVERIAPSKRKGELLVWLEHKLPAWLEDRMLSIDMDVAERWGALLAHLREPMPAIDSLLAATALVHNLKLVTRNVKDFIRVPGLEIINPWD